MADQYSRMLADTDRIEWFRTAIEKAVRPDDVIVDLGCGLGTFAMQASRAGAQRVYGVEMDSVVELAAKIAKLNGCDITFISGDARNVKIPEPVSLLIFEDYGTGLLDGHGAKLLELARKNWVAKNYRVLPEAASLHIAPITSTSVRKEVFPFGSSREPIDGFDFGPLHDVACNSVIQTRGESDINLIADPICVLKHDFMQPLPKHFETKVEFEFEGGTSFDGICLWHDLHLNEEITYSNHPKNFAIWGQFFFPAPKPWTIEKRDRLSVEISFADALTDGFWKWTLKQERDSETVEQFTGNTFASSNISGEQLKQYDVNEIVHLSDRGIKEAKVLSLVDGRRSVQQICDEYLKAFPDESQQNSIELIQHLLEPRKIRQAI